MKMNYRIGDFVKLHQLELYPSSRICSRDLNIFEILKLEDGIVQLKHIEKTLPISAIAPIPINGIDDKKIYYAPIIAGSCVSLGHSIPNHKKDKTYYFDCLNKWTWDGKTFQEITSDEKLEYVHEIQHFLQDRFGNDDLKIDAI